MKIYQMPLRLPSLNEYQNACRRHPLNGSQMKKNSMISVCSYLGKDACKEFPIQVEIYYTEPNKRRDVDNITGFGNKVILDSMQKAGIIPDDGPKFVNKVSASVRHENGEQNIIVVIQEKGDDGWLSVEDSEAIFSEAEKFFEKYGTKEKAEEPKKQIKKRKESSHKERPNRTLTLNI